MNQDIFNQEKQAIRGKLDICLFDGSNKTNTIDQWNRFYPNITPTQIYKNIQNNVGYGKNIQITIGLNADENKSSIDINHNPQNGADNIIDIEISDQSTAKLRSFSLSAEEQSHGLAKKYLSAIVNLLNQIKVKSISLDAGEIGGYAWAKYGFHPSSPKSWHYLKKIITDERLDIDNKMVKFKDKSYTLTDKELHIISKILDSKFLELPENFPQLTELNRVIGKVDGKDITVGKALLIDTIWEGVLPINDKHTSFQRFRTYTDPPILELERA